LPLALHCNHNGLGGGDHGPAPHRGRRPGGGSGAGAGPFVEGAGDGAGDRGERGPRRALLPHHAQAQPHRGDHPLAQRRRRAARLLPRPHVDRRAREVWRRLQALHQAGEHRHPDLRRRLLWPRLQRSVICPFIWSLLVLACRRSGWPTIWGSFFFCDRPVVGRNTVLCSI
jgi:hypothetical protein